MIFFYFTDLSKKINIQKDEDDNVNNIDNLKKYYPELIFVNNILPKEKIQEMIEKNPLSQNTCKLFEKKTYINKSEELLNKVKNELKYKTLENNIIDGDSLFCLFQNYIDLLNNDKKPAISLAIENVLLSKAKSESEYIFEEFKNSIYEKIVYPMQITEIYEVYLELQKKYTALFCEKVEKILTPTQTGLYIQKIFTNMGIELESILETNKQRYDDLFCIEYKEFENELN
jgi:hypothetical protein